jgi:hypothetical protein
MKLFKAFMAAVLLSFALMAGTVSASDSAPADAKGPVLVEQAGPEPDVGIQGFFDPSFLYLDQGDNSIVNNGNQTITINVTTIAKQTVNSIGATIFFDWWNGSSWVELNSTLISDANKKIFGGYATFSAPAGYYYRARTVHWVNHNGVFEQGVRVTATVLAT